MVERASGRTVFLTRRFDRLDEVRVPFLSAMSMPEAVDGQQGRRISPAYDVNPVPTDVGPRVLSTAIVEGDDRSASLDLAFSAAPHFGLEDQEARGIAEEVAREAAQWRKVARGLGASDAKCDRMASAFEHDDPASLT